jgi:hypothetical protein
MGTLIWRRGLSRMDTFMLRGPGLLHLEKFFKKKIEAMELLLFWFFNFS